MHRRRVQTYIFYALAILTLAFQAVNARHLWYAVSPYHHGFALAVTGVYILVPVAVILANTFGSNAHNRWINRVLFAVATWCFAGELWANLSEGAREANADNARILEIASLFGFSYRSILFTGAVAYSMAVSVMTAGLVWALSNAAQEVLRPTVAGRVPTPLYPADDADSPNDRQVR